MTVKVIVAAKARSEPLQVNPGVAGLPGIVPNLPITTPPLVNDGKNLNVSNLSPKNTYSKDFHRDNCWLPLITVPTDLEVPSY